MFATRKALTMGLMGLALASSAAATTLPAPSVLAGLNPGDTYQFVFVTSTTTAATNNTLAFYNNLVQGLANSAGIGNTAGVTWKAMVNVGGSPNRAIDNAPVAATTKVYLVNGTMVANGGSVPFYTPGGQEDNLAFSHLAGISITELGTSTSGFVWTGGNSTGTESGSGLVGGGSPVFGDVGGVLACRCVGGWARDSNGSSTSQNHLYAISAPLTFSVTATPEPATFGMAGVAFVVLGLLRRARKK